MKSIKQLSFIGLSLMLVLSSCTIEKRLYKPGYHVEWNSSTYHYDQQKVVSNDYGIEAEQHQIGTVESSEKEIKPSDNLPTGDTETSTASLDNTITPINTNPDQEKVISHFTSTEECDNIILTNGEEIKAKVLEILTDEIKYKKCDNLEGPTYTLKKSEVFIIKYPNGTKDVITPSTATIIDRTPSASNEGPKTEGLGVAGFIISLVGLFVAGIPLGLLAVIFGAISLGKISMQPKRFKGKGFGIASIILGLIAAIAALLIISAVL